jgi:hypothetical protein
MYEADRTPGADRDYLSDILVSKKKHEVIWYLPRATIHLKKKNEGKIDSPYTYTGMHTCVHTRTHTHTVTYNYHPERKHKTLAVWLPLKLGSRDRCGSLRPFAHVLNIWNL